MPKLRMTTVERCKKAYHHAMARAQIDLGLHKDYEMADKLKLSKSAYCRAKQEGFRTFGFEKAGALARSLKMTGREVCEIMGVPYDDPKND